MYKFSPHAIAPFISFVLSLFIAVFIYGKNRKSKIHLTLSAFAFFTSVWQFSTGMMFLSQIDALGIFWDRIVYVAVSLMFPTCYHFTVLFTKTERQKNWIRTGYVISVIYIFLIPTNYFVSGLYRYSWGSHALAKVLHHPFVLISTFFYLKAVYLVFLKYKQSQSFVEKHQFKYYFIGFSIYVLGTMAYLPAYKIGIYPFAYWFATIYVVALSYIIIRYKALEIDTVIHRTMMWVMSIVLLIAPIGIAYGVLKERIFSLGFTAVAVLISVTLLVFLGYYHRLRPIIDHFFRRRKYDYYQVLRELGQKIGSELELEKVGNRIFKELKDILYIRNGVLLAQQSGQDEYEEVGSVSGEGITDPSRQTGNSLLSLPFSSKLSQYLNKEQKALEREQVEADPQYQEIKEEALTWLKQKEIEVLIPIVLEGKVNGLIGIGKKENLQAYTQKDIELLEKMGRQLGVTIDNALHHKDIVEKGRLAEEMKLGQEIQMNLLPKEVPQIDGLKVTGLMIPAKEIGGDYYDYIVTNKGANGLSLVTYGKDEENNSSAISHKPLAISEVSIVIGDVSGKGVAAGLIMATAKATLKGLSKQNFTPKEMLAETNRLLFEYTKGDKFMTMLYLTWDNQQKKLNYSSAGHEHIIIYRNKKKIGVSSLELVGKDKETQELLTTNSQLLTDFNEVEVIQSGGFVLGMLPEIGEFLEDKELKLKTGDKVILYTDGVTEAHNPAEELYTLERLVEVVKGHGHQPLDQLITTIKDEVYGFISTQDQYDDITLVGMEIE